MKQSIETRKKISESKKGQIPWNKGIPMKEESKMKVSEALKGKPVWNKGKKGLQIAWNKGIRGSIKPNKTSFKKGHITWNKGKKTGLTPWNKGKELPKDMREKLSEIRKKLYSEGKLIPPMKGKHHTEEALRKMSEAGKRQSEKNKESKSRFMKEYWKTNKPPMMGKKHSRESLEKMRLASIGHIPWNKGKKGVQISWNKGKKGLQVAWNKGKHPSPETLKRQSESHKGKGIGKNNPFYGKRHTEESRRKMSEAIKLNPSRYWLGKKRPDVAEKSRNTLLKMYESGKFPLQENTKPERQIKRELLKRGYKEGIDFIHQFKFYNKFMCDFCFPQQKVIIECDGDYWHMRPNSKYSKQLPNKAQQRTLKMDKAKEAYIKKADNGSWTLLRFWESDIKKDVSKCVDKIEITLLSYSEQRD